MFYIGLPVYARWLVALFLIDYVVIMRIAVAREKINKCGVNRHGGDLISPTVAMKRAINRLIFLHFIE